MNRNLLRMISLLPLIVACNHDGAPELPTGDNITGMAIGGVSLSVSDKPGTRAGNEGTVTAGSIGIFLTDASTGNYSNRDNCGYTYTGGKWAAFDEDNIVSVRTLRPALLWAVYPYHADHTEQTAIPLSPRAFSNAEDVCYGPGTTTDDKYCQNGDRTKIFSDDSSTPVPVEFLNMKHTYAWFTFEIKKGNYHSAGVVSRIRVGNIVGHTTMDISADMNGKGATIADATSTTYQAFTLPLTTNLTLPADGNYVSTSNGNGDMLLVPCALANAGTFGGTTQCGLKVTITADGEEYFAGIPVSMLGKLEAGKHYTVQLTLQDMNLSDILVVVSSEWKAAPDLPGSSDGNYDMGAPISIKVPKGDINLGGADCTDADKEALSQITWAAGNLKSTGASNYVMAGSTEYGYYYQWQQAYDGTNVDPCTLLDATKYGSGWVAPSKETWEQLSRCTNKALTDKGMWFMNNTKGVFLPAAGYRSSSSGTSDDIYAGENGLYWSREESSSTSGYSLDFVSGDVSIYGNSKANGLSVRCVQEPPPPPPYIQVPKDDIGIGISACTDEDKTALSKIKWAEGNLASTGSSNYVMAGPKEYGYYYQWQKYYEGTTTVDPCTLLDAAKYGSGWVTPSYATLQAMARCSDKTIAWWVNATGSDKAGRWFMNKTTGVFLPAAGNRTSSSGMSADSNAGGFGYYWSREENGSSYGYSLNFNSGSVNTGYSAKANGFSVRCVQE